MSMKRIIRAVFVSLAVILTVASGAMMQQRELLREEFHEMYPIAAGGRVSVANLNGAVRVTAWDRNEVKVDAVKSAYRRERLDEAKIVVRSDINGIQIETTYPPKSTVLTDGNDRYSNSATVEYALTVPRTARIDSIELINGNLDIDGITGDVKASSINGRVSAHELMGEVRLSAVNGKVEAIFGRLNEAKAISLGSVNGPVTLTIPSDSNAQLKASTVHGSITNEFGLPVRSGQYVGRDLAGQLGEGGARIKLGNVNGPITIKHAPDGRPLSRVTNLLAEKVKNKEGKHDDDDFDVDESRSEGRRASREATRERARDQLGARRAELESQRAQLAAKQAQRQAEAQIARAQIEVKRAEAQAKRAEAAGQPAQAAGQRAAREAQSKAVSIQIEAQQLARQAQLAAQRAQVEGVRVAREASRIARSESTRARIEAQRVLREEGRIGRGDIDRATSLRLVERESKTFNVRGTPQINLQTFDGHITVRGWDKQEVLLTFNKRAASEQQMRGIRLRTEQNGSNINVVAGFDPKFARRDTETTFPNAVVNLDVFVPRSSMVRLTSGDGRLEVDGVNGNLGLTTGDGRIDVRDARGRLTAKTSDGRIQVENFDGEVDAQTGDGRIILSGRFGQLTARTGSGSILLTVPAGFNATIETDAESVDGQGVTLTSESGSSRRLKRWKIGQGGRVLSLRTGEGRIFLRRAAQ